MVSMGRKRKLPEWAILRLREIALSDWSRVADGQFRSEVNKETTKMTTKMTTKQTTMFDDHLELPPVVVKAPETPEVKPPVGGGGSGRRDYRQYVQDVRVHVVRETGVAISDEQTVANKPELVAKFWREVISTSEWYDPEKEMFVALHLNVKNRVRAFTLITLGTATSAWAHPREVFRAAIVNGAVAVVCMHNHPSGDPAPSTADVQVTRMLRDAGQTVQIALLDHVIVGHAPHDPRGVGYYSFREAGIL
jgi:DNA repair protein RadC